MLLFVNWLREVSIYVKHFYIHHDVRKLLLTDSTWTISQLTVFISSWNRRVPFTKCNFIGGLFSAKLKMSWCYNRKLQNKEDNRLKQKRQKQSMCLCTMVETESQHEERKRDYPSMESWTRKNLWAVYTCPLCCDTILRRKVPGHFCGQAKKCTPCKSQNLDTQENQRGKNGTLTCKRNLILDKQATYDT